MKFISRLNDPARRFGYVGFRCAKAAPLAKEIVQSRAHAAREAVRLIWGESTLVLMVELFAYGVVTSADSPMAAHMKELTEAEKQRVRIAVASWAREAVLSQEMEELVVRIWTQHFSQDELVELATVYRTPVGARFGRLPGQVLTRAVEVTEIREALERWDGESPLPPAIQGVIEDVRRGFAPDELEEMQRFVEIPVVRRLIKLTPVLTAETTREMERVSPDSSKDAPVGGTAETCSPWTEASSLTTPDSPRVRSPAHGSRSPIRGMERVRP